MNADSFTSRDIANVGGKVIGMVGRLQEAERFVADDTVTEVSWSFAVDGRWYRLSLKRAAEAVIA